MDKNQRAAQDLEAFAQHAKRSNITGEDVKLLTRRNPHLVTFYTSHIYYEAAQVLMTWGRRCRDGMDATLKDMVDERVTKMETDFKAYKIGMAAKKKAFQPIVPPHAVNMPGSNGAQAQLIQHLQQEKREEQTVKLITKKNQVQSGMEELLAEVKIRDWQRAQDA